MNGHSRLIIAAFAIIALVGFALAVYLPRGHHPAQTTVTVTHRDLNCSDYTHSFPTPAGDPNHLDADHDGTACDSLTP